MDDFGLGLLLGVMAGIVLDRFLLIPLVMLHARLARHGRA